MGSRHSNHLSYIHAPGLHFYSLMPCSLLEAWKENRLISTCQETGAEVTGRPPTAQEAPARRYKCSSGCCCQAQTLVVLSQERQGDFSLRWSLISSTSVVGARAHLGPEQGLACHSFHHLVPLKYGLSAHPDQALFWVLGIQ